MVILVRILMFLLLCNGLTSETTSRTMPIRFETAIRQIQEWYASYPNNVLGLVNVPLSSVRENFLFRTHDFSETNATTTCKQDLQVLITAASEHQLWAMKVLDAWGKPLPSGVLTGNIYWLGNYDECLHPLYQNGNKSFVRQPINTQYCKFILVIACLQRIDEWIFIFEVLSCPMEMLEQCRPILT